MPAAFTGIRHVCFRQFARPMPEKEASGIALRHAAIAFSRDALVGGCQGWRTKAREAVARRSRHRAPRRGRRAVLACDLHVIGWCRRPLSADVQTGVAWRSMIS